MVMPLGLRADHLHVVAVFWGNTESVAGPASQFRSLIASIPIYLTAPHYVVYLSLMPPTKATLPTFDNPVVALRGSTLQRTFAFRLGISRMALLRMEQGCLPEPSTKLKPFLPDGLSWAAFVEDYRAYQEAKRIANYGVLTDDIDFSGYHHPLEEWIDQSADQPSLTSVCVALCLHLPIMHRFLNGPYPALPPESFLEALKQSGYDTPVVMDFVMTYAEWRNG